ncbi:MAG: M14 family zinc carboxypeptidase [Acidobacteriota bacterium]
MTTLSQTAPEFAEIWDKQHASHLMPSDVRHKDLQKYLDDLKKIGLKVDEVGRSFQNREIYQLQFGKGPLKVFMWSQMHGDEPTATSALIDVFTFLQKNRQLAWVKKIEETMTFRAVPMLNPDGEEVYQRRSSQDIDINRDAIDLKTPEAQLLKKLRDDWSPAIGFNLHDQNALTTTGNTNKQAAMSLLVVYGDAAKTPTDGLDRNRRICGLIVKALQPYIPGQIGRYDDEYTATAFGDNFSAWGTSVILIETGGLHGKDGMYLVKMNFIALMTAIHSLADGGEKTAISMPYDMLPHNSSGRILTYIFRNAVVIDRDQPDQIVITSIGAVSERRRASFSPQVTIRAVSSLTSMSGLEEYDASNFYVIQRFGRLKPGENAELLFFKKDRQIDWKSPTFEKDFPPDAMFSLGKFVKGSELFTVR